MRIWQSDIADYSLFGNFTFPTKFDWDDFYYDKRNFVLAQTDTIDVGKQSLETATLNLNFFKKILKNRKVSMRLFGLPIKFDDNISEKVLFKKNEL